MRNLFQYEPPRLLQNFTYAVMLMAYLAWLEFYGPQAWTMVVTEFGLFGAFVGFGFAFYMGWFWLVATPYLLLDHYQKPRWLYRFKIQLRRDGRSVPTDPAKLRQAMRVVLFNQFFGTLPVLMVVYPLMVWRGLGVDQPVPGSFEVLWQLAIILLVEEILFYTVHRTLHRKYLYSRIHRIHHEHKESIAITTHYVHYLEHLFGNLLPIFAGVFLVGAHPLTALAWIGLAVTNALHSHSGYNFPWQAWSVHHDYHHFRVRGNYGVLGVLDWMLNTDGPMRQLHANYLAEQERECYPLPDGELSGTQS